jgi:hypothetical protein
MQQLVLALDALGGFRQVVTWPTDDAVDVHEEKKGIRAGFGF